jgi:DNA polymerase III sliding clamp (beta) subunit (PCNA family)
LGFALPNQKPTETALFPEDQNIVVLEVTKELETEVKNAAKFVGRDELNPKFTHIRFEVEAGALRLVASDGHTLYMGQILPSSGLPNGLYCLPVFQPKAGDKITFNLTKREATHGANVMKIEEYQLNWKSVIPNWVEGEMVFDRKAVYTLVDNVKKAASDIKNKVKFHLNGSIQATAGDDNLKTSATASTPYESKTFDDFDTSFNGKLFNRSLSVLQGKKATFRHSGAKRPALLTDSVREVVIMPLIID